MLILFIKASAFLIGAAFALAGFAFGVLWMVELI